MSDLDIPQSQTEYPLWVYLESVDKKEIAVDGDYEDIEMYNTLLIEQVADVNESELQLDSNGLLFLQPDTRLQRLEQGEVPELASLNGDPHIITGSVPHRTNKLIVKLLANASAVQQANDTNAMEVWRGNISGKPVKFVFHHSSIMTQTESGAIQKPTLDAHVYSEHYTTENMLAREAFTAARIITEGVGIDRI